MAWIDALLLGLLQSITQYLPVSSFGHALLLGQMRGLTAPPLLLAVVLHLGGAMAVLVVYRRDFIRIFMEFLNIFTDCISNAYIYFHNRRTPEHHVPLNRVVVGTWRKLTFLLFLSSLVTALLGYLGRNLVLASVEVPLLFGGFSLATGVILLVTDLSRVGGKKNVREAGSETGIWLGIAQGLSVFPGLSRFALTNCTGLLCGLSRRFMAKFSCMMSVPAALGAFILTYPSWSSPAVTPDVAQGMIWAGILSFILGLVLLRTVVKLFARVPLKVFALYDLLFGGFVLIRAFR